MNKIIASLFAALFLISVATMLVACNGKDNNTLSSEKTSTETEAEAETEAEIKALDMPEITLASFGFATPTQIKPEGWLRDQLQIQADGLSGNLDSFWPDIADSAWIGGEHEGWERFPYWLDGYIPLSYLLDDEEMIAKCHTYISAIIGHQCEDGWICPCSEEERVEYDLWSAFLIGKVMALYCSYNPDDEVAYHSLYKMMTQLNDFISQKGYRLQGWGKARWYEALVPLKYILERDESSREWVTGMARILKKKGQDYIRVLSLWSNPEREWTYWTHIVNVSMCLKYEFLFCEITGDEPQGDTALLWNQLETYNGTAVGTFTGDECLAGIANNRGTELCSVVELMYSCEWNAASSGDALWADRLEKISFNALPAAFTDDMWAHQYDQMVNQISAQEFDGNVIYGTNGADANVFGLEPNYGCCTANMNQGWPKFALSSFMTYEDGIVSVSPVPSTLQTVIGDTAVSVKRETEYPFENTVKYTVTTASPISFTIRVRVPAWADEFVVDGVRYQGTGKATWFDITREWKNGDCVTTEYITSPKITSRPNEMYVVEYGALVFSLPIEAKITKIEGEGHEYPHCDYEYLPTSEWRYALSSLDASSVEVVKNEDTDIYPFSSVKPRIILKVNLTRIDWNEEPDYPGVSANVPESKKAVAESEELFLIPYGCTKLRITEMPLAEN